MGSVVYTQPDGTVRELEAEAGQSVMQLATKNGVRGILAQCGGTLSCATCHVYVDETDLADCGPLADFEDDMLDTTAADRLDCSRLSCQVKVGEGQTIRVTIPPTQL
ncbi:2Fe-2S iron-sulfur cluster-binding protein [Microbacterium sp. zg-Y818]|uniref:2Fe-2S iron-sulfur cluster-binding protein n=1 Tax=unclassified Microbacterium TaxID=2609290 RepID=UPI00214B8FAB|nr:MULTISPECIES: 2Fe-2S iron-sulfur cluster-binding protein [unclassified Microbacterium]MCR2799364.1 2Fe-2S iron-sulfur cluster-binding protein [Microbacterium sp. zg.Y818]WIM21363.1 2Fe-2S iron-sulfur cluster-binding protein [Microbacterium sp. zg-Y818]